MSWLNDNIKGKGERIAVVFQEKEYSYKQLAKQISRYYNELSQKIPKGAIVTILSDYNFESICVFFALYQNKNIIVPITTNLKSEISEKQAAAGWDYSIHFEGSSYILRKNNSSQNHHFLVRELQKVNRAGLILFSSGSTGIPKAMVHDLDKLINTYKNKRDKRLIFLIFLMFDHIGGLNTLLNCISMGATMVFPLNRTPDHVCYLIEKYKVNILPSSPTFLNLILISEAYKRYDLSSLRMITYGTEPMPDSLLLNLKNIFFKVKFLQTFGTSETGISQTSSRSSTSTYIKINDPNTEYKIVNGELLIRSKTQILGYLNHKMTQFTKDGWFKTGDIVEEIDDGYIKIIGRNQEIINVGGEKVLPSEVETILFQMPGVKDCIVYGESNPITGQMVVAKILFNETLKVSEAKKRVTLFCKNKLERYKIPAKVVLMNKSEFSDRFKKKRI